MYAAIISNDSWRAIGLAARQHRPDDPGILVGHGNGDEPGRLALVQVADPVGSRRIRCSRSPHHRCRADHEQFPEIAISHLRDTPQPVLAA